MMSYFDTVPLEDEADIFGLDSHVLPFDQEAKDASASFVLGIVNIAVRKIEDPAARQRVRYLMKPKVASKVIANERSGDELTRSVQSDWMHFAAQNYALLHVTREILGHRAVRKIAINRTPVQNTSTQLSELLIDTAVVHPKSKETAKTQLDGNDVVENVAFKASSELIAAWLDGLNAVRKEGGHEALPSVSSETQEYYAAELTRQLRKIISNFAIRKSYDGGAYNITFGGKFLPSIEGLIEDHLMLPPRNAVVFLDIFKEELYNQSSLTPVFSGRWGELKVDDAGELVLKLIKRRSRKLSSVLRGK